MHVLLRTKQTSTDVPLVMDPKTLKLWELLQLRLLLRVMLLAEAAKDQCSSLTHLRHLQVRPGRYFFTN